MRSNVRRGRETLAEHALSLCRLLGTERRARSCENRQAQDCQQDALDEPGREGFLENQHARQSRQGRLRRIQGVDIDDAGELK